MTHLFNFLLCHCKPFLCSFLPNQLLTNKPVLNRNLARFLITLPLSGKIFFPKNFSVENISLILAYTFMPLCCCFFVAARLRTCLQRDVEASFCLWRALDLRPWEISKDRIPSRSDWKDNQVTNHIKRIRERDDWETSACCIAFPPIVTWSIRFPKQSTH